MAYVLFIHEPRGQREARSESEGQAAYEQMVRWGQGLKARGLLLASESLKSDREAAHVQRRDGRDTWLDGPYSEAREMIGGFFLLDCASRTQAQALAAECPAAAWATVELRETGPCFL